MGVMKNMLHSDSLRTVTSVNGSHFDGRLGRLPMENGACSFHAGPSKYKRRHVSAVRDFPPGCGTFAPQAQSPEVLKSLVPTAMLERISDLASKEEKVVVSSDQVNGVELLSAELVKVQSPASNNAGLSEPVKGLERETSDLSKHLHLGGASASKDEEVFPSGFKFLSPPDCPIAVPNGNGLERTMAGKYPPRRIVSAVRDFPHLCGRNAPCLSTDEKSDMDDRKETVKADVQQMGKVVKNRDAQKSELQGNVPIISGDKVGAESEGCAIREIRKQAEFGMSSEMKEEQEDIGEKCIKPSCENNQYQFDHKSETFVKETRDIGASEEKKGKEVVVYLEDSSLKRKLSDISGCHNQLQTKDFDSLEFASDRVVVLGLKAAQNCPWSLGRGAYKLNPAGAASESKGKKYNFLQVKKYKSAVRTKDKGKSFGVKSMKKKKSLITGSASYQGMGHLVISNKEDSVEHHEEYEDFHVAQSSCSFGVNVPPIGLSISDKGQDSDAVTRNKVRETLRLFQAVSRKLLQEEEGKSKERGSSRRRVDCQAAKILKEKRRYVNTGKQILGPVPGVEVGDEFHYRVELNIVGLHRQTQAGIDFVKCGGKILATSVVASGGYADDMDNSDSLIYTGQGGNVMNADKEPEDQKLERGNLSLWNSWHEKNPVRVIRGSESLEGGRTYIYDGLYLVEKFWKDLGPRGKLVFKFRLDRMPNQPELAWKEVKKSKKFKIREGLCVDDISQGKESIPICAVNTIDDEKPPPFEYRTSVIYPNWCRRIPLEGCNCTSGCSDSEKCSCAVKNGGEIPFNYNGAIVEVKSLVYECSPSCKCPSSCHNRVSQHGIKFQLEIFKTKSRGWGVRSLNSIPSGSFICEYVGELLEEKEAEQRAGNDEYLFDIGNNYSDNSLWDDLSSLMPDAHPTSHKVVEDGGGFTIDAVWYGNVGRFINHSCSPNLYAQNVLYDHADKRIPHIMFFAAENIPPLQELTYHYNYMIDQVRDSNGNIKKKSCYCGSIECTGRMY